MKNFLNQVDPYHNVTPGVLIAAVATILLVACAFALLRLTEMRNQNN